MNAVHPVAETEDTVTLRRADFEMMLEAVEDAEDIIVLQGVEAREKEVGSEAARADHLPVELVVRLMAGEHPARIWREHRGLSPQALADKAGVGRSYLVEIEGYKKPGSVAAYRRLASALRVPIDDLLPATDQAAQAFEDWLVQLADEGDPTVIERVGSYIDQHLAAYSGNNVAGERMRLAAAFRDKMPESDLADEILKKIVNE